MFFYFSRISGHGRLTYKYATGWFECDCIGLGSRLVSSILGVSLGLGKRKLIFSKLENSHIFPDAELKLCRWVKDLMGQVMSGLEILGRAGRHDNKVP